jgi:hypothetical protein
MDAGMPMPTLVFLIPMPSYAYNTVGTIVVTIQGKPILYIFVNKLSKTDIYEDIYAKFTGNVHWCLLTLFT